jgi:hypothetical protein
MYIHLTDPPIEHFHSVVRFCSGGKWTAHVIAKLGIHDDSAAEEKFDTYVAGTVEAITGTNKCLSYLRRAPAVRTIDIRHRCSRVEVATVLGLTEKRLEDSAHGPLGVLALLLEAGADSMPEALLDRLRNSCLLSDERLLSDECLRSDAKSLPRIKALLDHNWNG